MKILNNIDSRFVYKIKKRGNHFYFIGAVNYNYNESVDCYDVNDEFLGKFKKRIDGRVFISVDDYINSEYSDSSISGIFRFPHQYTFQVNYDEYTIHIISLFKREFEPIGWGVCADKKIISLVLNEYFQDVEYWAGKIEKENDLLLPEVIAWYSNQHTIQHYVDLTKISIDKIRDYYIKMREEIKLNEWADRNNLWRMHEYFGKNFIEYTDAQINNIVIKKLSTYETF